MRYAKIFTSLWNNEKFQGLSEKGKLLYIYLLSSPHSTCLGAYNIKPGYIQADLEWAKGTVKETLQELFNKGFIQPLKTGLIIHDFFEYNSLDNPNQLKAALNSSVETISTQNGTGRPLRERRYDTAILYGEGFMKARGISIQAR